MPTRPVTNDDGPLRGQPLSCVVEPENRVRCRKEWLERRLPLRKVAGQGRPDKFAVDLVVLMDKEVAVGDGDSPLDSLRRKDIEPGQPICGFTQFHHE
jgi:hypothetical protein